MTNGNDFIGRVVMRQVQDNDYRPARPREENDMTYIHVNGGLTKREYFAAMAMQGFISNSELIKITKGTESVANLYESFACDAVSQADALIEALNNTHS